MKAPLPHPPLGLYAALGLACLLAAAPRAGAGDKKDKQGPAKVEPKIVLSLSAFGQFGLQLIDRGTPKKITFDEQGRTNLTVVSVDGKHYVFGMDKDSPEAAKLPEGLLPGKWVKKPFALVKGKWYQAVWAPIEGVQIRQTLELVRSKTGALDTCLVRYGIENKGAKAHKVGLRLMIDTFIGDNDGHPFALPGTNKLITTSADYQKKVPPVVQALQKPDLKNPGLVAYFSLKGGGEMEGPQRFSITRLPLRFQEFIGWEIPVRNIKMDENDPGDAAVVLYWEPREVQAGARRELIFAYGGGILFDGPEDKKK